MSGKKIIPISNRAAIRSQASSNSSQVRAVSKVVVRVAKVAVASRATARATRAARSRTAKPSSRRQLEGPARGFLFVRAAAPSLANCFWKRIPTPFGTGAR